MNSRELALAAFTAAQTKESDVIAKVHELERQLQAAQRQESDAAVAAIDGGGDKPVREASKLVTTLTGELRISRMQADTLTERRKDAATALAEATADEAHATAEAAYQQYDGAVTRLCTALSDANAAIQAVRVRAEDLQSQYRMTGQRGLTLTLHALQERLVQTVVNGLPAVHLLEKSNSTPDLLGPVAAFVSAIGAGRPAPKPDPDPKPGRDDDDDVGGPFALDWERS